MQYRYETHIHSSQCSKCALSTSQEMVRALHSAGYAGMVLTDHFIFGNTAVDRSLAWEQKMNCYYQSYLDAKAVGDELDFDVIFGIEHAYGNGKEVLIYGIELDFLLANPDIPNISLDEFVRRVHACGGIVIQAHPYRSRSYINMEIGPRTDIVDGIEVINTGNMPQENVQALRLAESGDFIMTCGGDIHLDRDVALMPTGIALPCRVHSSREFAEALKRREHGFIIDSTVYSEIKDEYLL